MAMSISDVDSFFAAVFFRLRSSESVCEVFGGTNIIWSEALKSDVLPTSMANRVLRSVRALMSYLSEYVGPYRSSEPVANTRP